MIQLQPNPDGPDFFQFQRGLLTKQLALVPRCYAPRSGRSGIHEPLLCEGKEPHVDPRATGACRPRGAAVANAIATARNRVSGRRLWSVRRMTGCMFTES